MFSSFIGGLVVAEIYMSITRADISVEAQAIPCWIGFRNSESYSTDFEVFNDVSDFLAAGLDYEVICLNLPAEAQDQELIQLRCQPSSFMAMIKVITPSPLSEYLANGLFQPDFKQELENYWQRKSLIKLPSQDDVSYRLLSFMWLFPEYRLQPVATPEKPHLYEYPLLQLLTGSAKASQLLLDKLLNRHWLAPTKLKDRVRLCCKCHSGHLNYIDLCPQCRSIEIDMQTSLHCFNCGHVDSQQAFSRSGGLSCPNCLQRLRHIGVDYDRPIENQHCNSCNSLFLEAKVEAVCLHCGHGHQPDELTIRRISDFELAEQGRELVRHGVQQQLFAALGEQMSRAHFLWLLQWHNQLALRHGHEHLLLVLDLQALAPDLAGSGEARALTLLDALKQRLLSLVRVTDACSSHDDQGVLLLLPYTGESQLPALKQKLQRLNDSVPEGELRLRLKAVSLPDQQLGAEVESWLASRLQQAEVLDGE